MLHFLYFLPLLLTGYQQPLCTCVPIYPNIEEEVKTYDLIFKGKVEKIDTINYVPEVLLGSANTTRDSGYYVTGLLVTLTVHGVLKGTLIDSTIKIMTGIGGGDCGYYFQLKKNYMIYANKRSYIFIDEVNVARSTFKSHDESFFETDVCDRTTDKVKEEELMLRKILRK